ncbi:MAG: Mrp/NBP35 family ATP-binding protein [Rhodospirillaceae bacterium]|nr:Mrp/NBP35 family ATP-binding protein [Rhodospirillaceae bacterium]
MADVTRETILAALGGVKKSEGGKDVVSLGMISGIVIRDGNVGFAIEVEPSEGAASEPLREACAAAVEAISGVLSVTAVLTAERPAQRGAGGNGGAPDAPSAAPQAGHGAAPDKSQKIPGIGAILAVASGKGGVGKSTTAVNLAVAMAADGARVGLLDCDVYGPSIPRLMRLSGQPEAVDGSHLMPMENYGVKCMSMGFLVEEDTPMIWRGPMVMSALGQMLRDVRWGELDILVCDLPPGTGDAQLTMAQNVPLTGAVIVSTPQDIALLDVRRGIAMFERVDVPIFGIIENMSYFLCPHCGERSDIFSHGGARETAAELGVGFLGEIPLDGAIRTASDAGQPIVLAEPQSPHTAAYRGIAKRVLDLCQAAEAGGDRSAPNIVMM